MRYFFPLLLLFVIVHSSSAQLAKSKTYTVEGEVRYSSFYQGGVDQGHIIPEQFPLMNQELVLVRLDSINAMPEKFLSFKTNAEGKFKLDLPSGIYGIVIKENLSNLQYGQFLPSSPSSGDAGIGTTVSWRFSSGSPIIVEVSKISDIVLLRHTLTICYKCP